MRKASSRTEAHRNLEVDGVLSSEKPVQGPEEITKPCPRSIFFFLHRSESMKDNTLSSVLLSTSMQREATMVEKNSSLDCSSLDYKTGVSS